MAESQLMCMEDGRIGTKIPDTKPEFLYSEEQRSAVEELLRNGDGAFKMRLQSDNMKDFLSAREVKHVLNTFKKYDSGEDGRDPQRSASPSKSQQGGADADSGVHSTYWPQMSDTEVPPLDMGWPSTGFFRGVTRVSVHTHPPKDNGPHIREVVRRLIQEATKVIAIVMDVITDPQILQDLMDAASRRSVPVYILLDEQGVPHFLDMCSRLQIGSQHLRNIRTRTLQGVGFNLSFGRLPGSLCYKYMLVDGDKVVFGSYSFCWATFRTDRNMITVMMGQVVDFFDRDFRELYAISEKLDLYKEFHVSPPATKATVTPRSKVGPKRPPLPATTSRFQVSLGDTLRPDIKVPAHKLYNPIYSLVVGDMPRPTGSHQEHGSNRRSVQGQSPGNMEPAELQQANSEKTDRLNALFSEVSTEPNNTPHKGTPEKKGWATWKKKFSKRKSSSKISINSLTGSTCPSPTPAKTDEDEDSFEVIVVSPPKSRDKKLSTAQRTESKQTINTGQDNESVKSPQKKKGCIIS